MHAFLEIMVTSQGTNKIKLFFFFFFKIFLASPTGAHFSLYAVQVLCMCSLYVG